ncbi:hypothetical protein [Glycomyces sp. NRRL B-16210]|uniref:hypothetical protein n=1 Tax=Glycomyces sp. NRRL B-16210 TaxID=1463821 RepID=UPI0004C1FE8B|nr:hypothetical protein [Glycomyces sp. NRRL B-16210]
MDPILLSIATAAAGALGGEIAKGIAAAGEFVRERFSGNEKQELTLLRAETGKIPAEDLAAEIERACAEDPAFLRQLSDLAGQPIQVSQVNQAGQQVKFQNNFFGGSGPDKLVQADRIENLRLD